MHSSSSCSMYASHVRTGKNCYQYIQILATHCSNIFTKANQSRYHNKQYYKLDSIDFTKPEAVATSWICLRCSWHWIVVDLSNSVWPFITLIFHEKLSMTFAALVSFNFSLTQSPGNVSCHSKAQLLAWFNFWETVIELSISNLLSSRS